MNLPASRSRKRSSAAAKSGTPRIETRLRHRRIVGLTLGHRVGRRLRAPLRSAPVGPPPLAPERSITLTVRSSDGELLVVEEPNGDTQRRCVCTKSTSPAADRQRYLVSSVRIPLAVTTTFATVCGSESRRPARLASRFQGAPMRIQSGPAAKRRESPGSSVPSKSCLPCSLRWRTESQHGPWVTRSMRAGPAGFVARLARPVVARAVRGRTGAGAPAVVAEVARERADRGDESLSCHASSAPASARRRTAAAMP